MGVREAKERVCGDMYNDACNPFSVDLLFDPCQARKANFCFAICIHHWMCMMYAWDNAMRKGAEERSVVVSITAYHGF
jgi:hypothetical protein